MNAWVICSVVIEKGGKFLLTQQAGGKFHEGKWAFPAGGVSEGETLLETAVREAKEETVLEVELESLVGIYRQDLSGFPSGPAVTFLFKGKIKGGKVAIPKDEIEHFRWVSLSELKSLKKRELRPMMSPMIEDVASGKEHPLEVISGNHGSV